MYTSKLFNGCRQHIGLLSKQFSTQNFEHIIVKTHFDGKVGLIQLNRPKALNALCNKLMTEVVSAVNSFDEDKAVKAMVITGSEKAFAAGADIKEMAGKPYHECYSSNFLSHWDGVAKAKKPVIAAVNGFALGGGCELAMMCDVIYAGDNAKFGQPEIKLGTIPGAGGTQRLVKAVGKSKAMELCLSGDMMSAKEAAERGLVSAVYPSAEVLQKALDLAHRMSAMSSVSLQKCKEAINASFNLGMNDGLHFEKRLFHASFATNDCKEGMTAFAEKRKAAFTDS